MPWLAAKNQPGYPDIGINDNPELFVVLHRVSQLKFYTLVLH